MTALKNGPGVRVALLAIVLSGWFALAMWHGAHADASSKGSSCSDPYRVHWGLPSGPLEGKYPEEMLGDTHFIKASVKRSGVGLAASWAPRVGGLKLCLVKATFDTRPPYIRHTWQRSKISIKTPIGTHVLSFVITAAR
jgi:hypothetical protein